MPSQGTRGCVSLVARPTFVIAVGSPVINRRRRRRGLQRDYFIGFIAAFPPLGGRPHRVRRPRRGRRRRGQNRITGGRGRDRYAFIVGLEVSVEGSGLSGGIIAMRAFMRPQLQMNGIDVLLQVQLQHERLVALVTRKPPLRGRGHHGLAPDDPGIGIVVMVMILPAIEVHFCYYSERRKSDPIKRSPR